MKWSLDTLRDKMLPEDLWSKPHRPWKVWKPVRPQE